jgi:hypothetical protein
MELKYDKWEFYNGNEEHSGVCYKWTLHEDGEQFGTIRYEIIPTACIVHVYPTAGITKSKLNKLRETNDALMEFILMDQWNFEEVYYVTPNDFLVRFLSRNTYDEVGEVEDMPIYMSNLKEVLCHL